MHKDIANAFRTYFVIVQVILQFVVTGAFFYVAESENFRLFEVVLVRDVLYSEFLCLFNMLLFLVFLRYL